MQDDRLKSEIRRTVRQALAEDIGTGDATAALIGENIRAHARIMVREDCVLCGQAWLQEVFNQLDPRIDIVWHASDGDRLSADMFVCDLHGPARPLLTGERTSLNFLQTLSAVATRTNRYVQAVAGTRAAILDTRKTIPGLRLALKYAVKTGGGVNHRIGLFDGILIKENHISAAGGIAQVLVQAQQSADGIPIQIEVESLDQLVEALSCGAELILLDNFDPTRMAEAVKISAGRAKLEASGGITLATVRAYAETGVDRISIGDLTKDIRAVDLSMRFISMN